MLRINVRNLVAKILDETSAGKAAFSLAHGTPVMFSRNIVSRALSSQKKRKKPPAGLAAVFKLISNLKNVLLIFRVRDPA
jgi:hypothetical protein